MAKKKRQHYVPKFYMRSFSDSGNNFYMYDIEKKRDFGLVPYKNQCQEDFFYGEDGIWEEALSKKENEWAKVINKLKESTTIDDEVKKSIKQFALYQRQRTLGEAEFHKETREKLLIVRGKMLFEGKNLLFDEKAEQLCKERARNSISPAEILQMADEFVPYIEDLNVLVIDYKTKAKLISSDVPVVAINPFHLQSIGYGIMGLILLFPISPDKLVVIYDDRMYPRFRKKQYIASKNEKEVHNLNVLQLISAEKIIFGNIPMSVCGFSTDEWKIREKNRRRSPATVLGSATRKLIAVEPRKTIHNFLFSFGKVSYSFDKIPQQCREAVPRRWDEGWQHKLETKGSILGMLSEDVETEGRLKLSKKEIETGCKKMLEAAKNYWKL